MHRLLNLFLLAALFHWTASPASQSDPKLDPRCKRDGVQFPKNDLPSAQESKELKGCESRNFYYGIGTTVNYEKARKCAFVEYDEEYPPVIGGPSVLMMIYANGFGVKRDLDLAIQLHCKVGSGTNAEAEIEGRMAHLEALKKTAGTKPFDFCDDITSGFMMGHCQSIKESITASKRKGTIEGMMLKMLPAHKAAFQELFKVADHFHKERLEGEVDTSGTARAAEAIEEEGKLEETFKNHLRTFEDGKFPKFTAADFKKADLDLNAIYSKIMKAKNYQCGSLTQAGIKLAQQKWLLYRDAWAKFSKVHYPNASIDALKTLLTRERVRQLEEDAVCLN